MLGRNCIRVQLELDIEPISPRGNFVDYDFLILHYMSHKMKYVSPLGVAALTCEQNNRYKSRIFMTVLLLLIYCLMYFPLFMGVLCLSLFCYALLCVRFSFVISLKRKRKLTASLLLSCRCIITINVLWLFFLTVPWFGLQYVAVVFPDHTHLPF